MRIDDLRKDIILKKNTRYFDFTASALALKSVEKKIRKILLTYANTHSESSSHALLTQKYFENARISLKKSLNLNDNFALIGCGTGSSAAIKKFQELLGLYVPPLIKERYFKNIDKKSLPLVIVGPYEHHSNELSFREALCENIRIPLDKKGEIDYKILEETLRINQGRKIILSFSLASNVTGILSDYKRISALGRKFGAFIAYDASTFIPYKNIDCEFYDALFISSHKLLGGVGGCGILVIKKQYCNEIPSFAAGGTVGYVSRKTHFFIKDKELLEEAGTPGILQLIRASLAFQIRDEIGCEEIERIECKLRDYFFERAQEIPNLELYAKNLKNRLAIFSFNIQGISPFELANNLSKHFYIQTRAGCACAGPYGHDLLRLKDDEKLTFKPGWLRVGFHYIHQKNDVDYFFESLKQSIQNLS